jgi:hypothetical protein
VPEPTAVQHEQVHRALGDHRGVPPAAAEQRHLTEEATLPDDRNGPLVDQAVRVAGQKDAELLPDGPLSRQDRAVAYRDSRTEVGDRPQLGAPAR